MHPVQLTLSKGQIPKIKKAIKENNNVRIRVSKNQLNENGPHTIMINPSEMYKLDLVSTKGKPKDIIITRENLMSMKEGGFLQFLVPAAIGLVTSMLGKGMDTLETSSSGKGLYLGKDLD